MKSCNNPSHEPDWKGADPKDCRNAECQSKRIDEAMDKADIAYQEHKDGNSYRFK